MNQITYSSIHLRGIKADIEDAVKAYKEKTTETISVDELKRRMEPFSSNLDEAKAGWMLGLANINKIHKYAIFRSNNAWSTLLSDGYIWENIFAEAKRLSSLYREVVLAASLKSRSVFQLYLFHNSEIITSHVVGPDAVDYFEDEHIGDSQKIAEFFSVDAVTVKKVLLYEEFSKQGYELSKVLGINLVQDYKWLDNLKLSGNEFDAVK